MAKCPIRINSKRDSHVRYYTSPHNFWTVFVTLSLSRSLDVHHAPPYAFYFSRHGARQSTGRLGKIDLVYQYCDGRLWVSHKLRLYNPLRQSVCPSATMYATLLIRYNNSQPNRFNQQPHLCLSVCLTFCFRLCLSVFLSYFLVFLSYFLVFLSYFQFLNLSLFVSTKFASLSIFLSFCLTLCLSVLL